MAQESSFFNAQLVNGSYDRVYNAENWAAYFASFLGNGVSVNPTTGLQVQAGSGMNIIVAIGTAFINGYRYANTMPLGVTINMANATYPRITSVILELNLNDRSILVKTLDGTPSNTPVAPTLTRTTGIYQLQLATILIPAGTTQITTGNITDTRADISVCGFIKGLFGENQSITTAEEIKKIKEQIANLDNTYLTANSSPTLMNNWTFGYNGTLYFNNSSGTAIIGFQTEENTQFTMFNPMTNNCLFYLYPVTSTSDTDTISWNCNNTFQDSVTITGTGYLYFQNASGKNILCAQVNTNEFSITNSLTGNNITTITPVSSGVDTINCECNYTFDEDVTITENGTVFFQNSNNENIITTAVWTDTFELVNSQTNAPLLTVTPVTSGTDTINIPANINFKGNVEINGNSIVQVVNLGQFQASLSDGSQYLVDISYELYQLASVFGILTIKVTSNNAIANTEVFANTKNQTFQLPGTPLEGIASLTVAPLINYPNNNSGNPSEGACYIAGITSSSFSVFFGEGTGDFVSGPSWSMTFKAILTN